MTRYQVVGECAHVVIPDHTGVKAMTLLYKGAYVPEGVDPERLQHLVDAGLVAEEPEVPVAPNAAAVQDGRVGIPPVGDAAKAGAPDGDGLHPVVTEEQRQAQRAKTDDDAEAERKQAEAQAKLKRNDDGTYVAPHANAGEDVWVEYAVTQGLDRGEATAAGKDELKKLFAK